MNKLFTIGIMILFIFAASAFLYADEGPAKAGTSLATKAAASDAPTTKSNISSYRLEVGDKAARGAQNVLFGWTELPKRVVDITRETKNPFWGVLAGTFQGGLRAMARTASGASDVATAPLTPEKDPLVKADINVP